MRKQIKFLVAMCVMLVMTATPVMAANVGNYTGWSIDGSPRYYENGKVVTDHWIRFGNTCYYMGADGYPIPDRVLSDDMLKQFSVDYIDTNGKPVNNNVSATVEKAVEILNVTNIDPAVLANAAAAAAAANAIAAENAIKNAAQANALIAANAAALANAAAANATAAANASAAAANMLAK